MVNYLPMVYVHVPLCSMFFNVVYFKVLIIITPAFIPAFNNPHLTCFAIWDQILKYLSNQICFNILVPTQVLHCSWLLRSQGNLLSHSDNKTPVSFSTFIQNRTELKHLPQDFPELFVHIFSMPPSLSIQPNQIRMKMEVRK